MSEHRDPSGEFAPPSPGEPGGGGEAPPTHESRAAVEEILDRLQLLRRTPLTAEQCRHLDALDALVRALPATVLDAGGADRAGGELRGRRVLLVEDDEVNQLIARELLEGEGVEVLVAGGGGEALRLLADERVDAVLMDIQMPDVDGVETTRRIRSDPRFARLPVIAMTASTMAGDHARFLAAGLDDHIAKPVDMADFFAVLRRWLTEPGPTGPAGAPATADEPPVLDTAGGLRRVLGDRAVYRLVLGKFCARFGDAAQRLTAAMQAGDREAAAQLVHNLKGTAGNLGATALHNAAAALERTLQGAVEPAPALRRLADILACTLAAMERAVSELE